MGDRNPSCKTTYSCNILHFSIYCHFAVHCCVPICVFCCANLIRQATQTNTKSVPRKKPSVKLISCVTTVFASIIFASMVPDICQMKHVLKKDCIYDHFFLYGCCITSLLQQIYNEHFWTAQIEPMLSCVRKLQLST